MTVDVENRFEFGKNWSRFLRLIDESRIEEAEKSIQKMLRCERLDGKTFLDAGCGSGLFSLAAHRLGATVHSFDYDPQCVACCQELRSRFGSESSQSVWQIEQGSVLDTDYLATLKPHDVVYSWGVLHHTGQMWQAIGNVIELVSDDGQFATSLYNDQGGASRRWLLIKKFYNAVPQPLKLMTVLTVGFWTELRQMLIRLVRLQNPLPFADWKQRQSDRGMSYWHDLVDWVGGYPFEVARPDEVFEFFWNRGFTMTGMTTLTGGYGCNEFVFRKHASTSSKTDDDAEASRQSS